MILCIRGIQVMFQLLPNLKLLVEFVLTLVFQYGQLDHVRSLFHEVRTDGDALMEAICLANVREDFPCSFK